MNPFKQRCLLLLLLAVLITSCASNELCMIERKDYSCDGFNVNGVSYEDEAIRISNIEYMSEGLKIKGILAEPVPDGKYPLIVFAHGGKKGIEEMNWIKELANKGYVVIASQYRGEGGSEGSVEVALGETTDVMNLLECGKSLDNADGEKIGIIGFSHGGGIAVQAMELSGDFDAGADFWGAVDIKKRFQNIKGEDDPVVPWVQAVGGAEGKDVEQELLKRSAIYCVDKISAPLLVVHGKLDKAIPYEYALDMINALKKSGKEYQFISFDNIGHEFEREDGSKDNAAEEEAMEITVAWFDKYLK